jgi:hypothetical protein
MLILVDFTRSWYHLGVQGWYCYPGLLNCKSKVLLNAGSGRISACKDIQDCYLPSGGVFACFHVLMRHRALLDRFPQGKPRLLCSMLMRTLQQSVQVCTDFATILRGLGPTRLS